MPVRKRVRSIAVRTGIRAVPCKLAEVRAEDFDGLVVPGGFMPDKLRRDPVVLQIVRDFHAIEEAHRGNLPRRRIPISAGVYRGVRVTGSPGIKDDLVNAGAIWSDEPREVHQLAISSPKGHGSTN